MRTCYYAGRKRSHGPPDKRCGAESLHFRPWFLDSSVGGDGCLSGGGGIFAVSRITASLVRSFIHFCCERDSRLSNDSVMVSPVVPHLIDGKDVPASDGATFDVFNPLTDEVLYRASAATLDDTNLAIETAHRAWKEWKTWGPSRRRQVLLKAADILESRKEEAMKLLSEEISAMPAWAAVNVMAGAAIFRESAALATHIKGEVVPADRPGKASLL
jgi:Aldehyde dehydrogenase family